MNELNFPDKFLRIYKKGDVVFREGNTGSHMYVIVSGEIQVSRLVNGEETHLTSIGKGEIFGEMALIENLPRSATATATQDDTHLLEIDHALFVYLVAQQPVFALVIIKAMSKRLRPQDLTEAEEILDEDEALSKPSAQADKGNGVKQIKENIFQLRGTCMAYVVKGKRKNLLIDTALPWEKDQLIGQLASIGLALEDIHIVALTHEHFHHIGCVPLFSPHTTIAAHAMTANKISMQDEFVLMSRAFHPNVEDYHIDFHLHHGTVIDLGGTVLQVLHTPGHSSGSICLYEAEQQLLFSGDTIFGGGILGGIFPSGSISDYALTLRQLSALKIKEFYPGHGRISTTPEEDFVKAIAGSTSLVTDTRSLFSVLDSHDEFSQFSKAISAYSRRV